jgi:hypothetical protein
MGSRAKTASNLNSASNIYTMHQISNMHHYLKLGEAGDVNAVEAEELESSSNVGSCYMFFAQSYNKFFAL